jgi:hypothetical protein
MTASLEGSGRLCGANRWAENRLFEMLGRWVPSTSEPSVKVVLDRHSLHHAWRADQWWQRLPVVADVDRHDLVVAPSPVIESVMDSAEQADSTVARLAAVYRVLQPRLAGSYARQRVLLHPVSDGSMIRTLDMVAQDLQRDWRDGELLLQGLLTSPARVAEASGWVERLELLLATNPTPWG